MEEKKYKRTHYPDTDTSLDYEIRAETLIHRQSLLQRFLLESLELKSTRFAVVQKQGPLIGAIAAGTAMFIYMILFLFVWNTPVLFINSIPFILSVVFFYILKDRVKEGLKTYYVQKAFRWFPDYSTNIFTQSDKRIGVLSEWASFISPTQIPSRIKKIRNQDSKDPLDKLQRHETVLYYKREISFLHDTSRETARRNHINTIFRLNLSEFVEKASDQTILKLDLDPETLEIIYSEYPKAYHINVVLKSVQLQANGEESGEIQKYRIIVDKTGIKRVEYLGKH